MANASLLFIDPKLTSSAEITAFQRLHAKKLPDFPLQVIDFFSSVFEDLQLISKHRVVILPTYIAITQPNKVAFKVSGRFPTAMNLELLASGDK
jgi:hypothetical protein